RLRSRNGREPIINLLKEGRALSLYHFDPLLKGFEFIGIGRWLLLQLLPEGTLLSTSAFKFVFEKLQFCLMLIASRLPQPLQHRDVLPVAFVEFCECGQ